MKHLSLRVQVFIIVQIFALGVFSATFYIANAISSARESIVNLSFDRLSSLTENLSRRYGEAMKTLAPGQIEATTPSNRSYVTALLTKITREELSKAPDVEAGFFHTLWNTEAGFATLLTDSAIDARTHRASYIPLLSALQQSTISERRMQWRYDESEGMNHLIVAKPVFAQDRLIGVAWAFDDLEDQLAGSWARTITPLLQIILLLGIGLATFFVIALRREVSRIQSGLDRMKDDLSTRLPASWTELGRISSSINNLADTIVRQQLEKEVFQKTMQQNEKLASLGQLTAGVAHEIRTPLAAIKTRVQLWQRAMKTKKANSTLSSSITPKSMALVVNELDRMESIVRKLLLFSKERQPHLQLGNIHTLIDSVLEVMQEDLNKRCIKARRRYEANNPFVAVDEMEMREVFLNLITNAADAMPNGGTLTVCTSEESEELLLTFEDSGTGIKPDVAGRIFDPFFTTKDKGTGLGLSIAYEIVRAHLGKLEYTGSGNTGARFEIRLPRTTQKRTQCL